MNGTTRTPILLDTDPGADDAVAMAVLAGTCPQDLVAVGSVFGNVGAPVAADNALRLLERFGMPDVPVAIGADIAIDGTRAPTGEVVHGVDGLGGAAGPPAARRPSGESAAEQLVRLAHEYDGDLSVLALGPLTNVALALREEPRLPQLLKQVVWMGGRIRGPGNITSSADANTFHDPHAAREVLDAAWLTRLRDCGRPHTDYLHKVTSHYVATYSSLYAELRGYGCAFHDSLAATVLLAPRFVTAVERHPVEVELEGRHTRGTTLVDLRPYDTPMAPRFRRSPVQIVTAVDEEAVLDWMWGAISAAGNRVRPLTA